MDVGAILLLLVAKWPLAGLVLSGLGALVVVGLAVVAMTPSTADDAKWEAIKAKWPIVGQLVAALAAFSPIQKK